jgi:hypothetical protein
MFIVLKGAELSPSEYVTLKYAGSNISGELFVCAVLSDSSGNHIFETGDFIEKPDFDISGNLTGLVLGLMACLRNSYSNIILDGALDMQEEPESNFFVELLSDFGNILKRSNVQNHDDHLAKLITEISAHKKPFYRDKFD